MRILIITKRQYMKRDLLDDRYGRFRELPLALARLGHDVAGICLSYRPRKEETIEDTDQKGQVVWHSLNKKRLLPVVRDNFWNKVNEVGKVFKPDLVWACSDTIHAILGVRVARKLGARLVIDLYDNFESFVLTRIPGMKSMFRRALRQADGITCVSEPLKKYVRQSSSYAGPIAVIENAVPKGMFRPMNRAACRRKLGLPENYILVGTAGAISKSRGIKTLFEAFEILALERPDIGLALAGPVDKGLTLPAGDRIHYLGMIPQQEVPAFLCSLDINVICNKDSDFGRYCFPQKFYEAVACKVSVVAAETGAMKDLLDDAPQCLFEPENVDDLAATLRGQINNPTILSLPVPTWNDLGATLDGFFENILHTSRHARSG
jgi:teichuronic acid biosynthesis glycosyltransferase TuaC